MSLDELLGRRRGLIRARLRDRATPLLLFTDAALPAASWWTGSRRWVEAGREAGLGPGSPVTVELPTGPGWAMVVVAALWEGWSLALTPPPWPVSCTIAARDTATWATLDGLNPERPRPGPAPPASAWWVGRPWDPDHALAVCPRGPVRWVNHPTPEGHLLALVETLANDTETLGFELDEGPRV